MKTIQVLDLDDMILPTDLVKNTLPLCYYDQMSSDEGESIIRWQYAKWAIPVWVGKTLRQFNDFGNKNTTCHAGPRELCIIRCQDCSPTILNGFLIAKAPDEKIQKLYTDIHGKKWKMAEKKAKVANG